MQYLSLALGLFSYLQDPSLTNLFMELYSMASLLDKFIVLNHLGSFNLRGEERENFNCHLSAVF